MSHVAVLVDCGSRRAPALRATLSELGMLVRVVPLGDANAEADSWTEVDAVVISGGPRLFTRDPSLVESFAFLDPLETPVLGICLGHQALGLRHGARIHLGVARRGPETLQVCAPHPLLDGLGGAPVLVADHREGISLPPAFTCLARSEHYAVEAMAHVERPRFGVQFHPEASDEAGRRVLENFVAIARRSTPRATPAQRLDSA